MHFFRLFFFFSIFLVGLSAEVKAHTPEETLEGIQQTLIKGQYRVTITNGQQALRTISFSRDQKAEVNLTLARAYQYKIIYDSAFYCFKIAMNIFEENKNIKGLTEGTIWLMEYYRSTSNVYQYRKMESQAENYLKREPNTLLQALFVNRKGAFVNQFYTDSSDYAKDLCLSSISMVQGYSSPLAQYIRANAMVDIGYTYEKKLDATCIIWYKKAQKIWEEMENLHYRSQIYQNLSSGYFHLKDYKMALIYSDSCMQIVERKNYADIRSSIYFIQSHIYEALGQPKEALLALRKYHASDYFTIQMDVYQMMTAAEELYLIERKEKELQLRIAEIELSEQIAERVAFERNVVAAMAGTLVVLILFLFFIFRKINRDREELKQTLELNRILLKEVNHRVKNNLTFLKSMLYLKEKYVSDPEVKNILIEFQSRIQAMAYVHTELYAMKDNRGWVDLNKIIDANVQEYISVMEQREVELVIHVEGKLELVKIDIGLSLMLMLNELITNSMKHIPSDKIEIRISLLNKNNRINVCYSDSGDGVTKDQFENATGFGLRMVRLMIKQVKGEISFGHKHINFSVPE